LLAWPGFAKSRRNTGGKKSSRSAITEDGADGVRSQYDSPPGPYDSPHGLFDSPYSSPPGPYDSPKADSEKEEEEPVDEKVLVRFVC